MFGPSSARRFGAIGALLTLLAAAAAARPAGGEQEHRSRIGPGPTSNLQVLGDAGGNSSSSSGGACVDWAPGIGGSSSGGAGSGSSGGTSSGSSSGASSSSSSSGGAFPADLQPPSAPGSVAVSAVTWSSATVSWTASTDDVGVLSYWIHALPAGGSDPITAWMSGCTREGTVTGLAPQTAYSFTVEAEDLHGNRTRSAPAAATTADPPPFMLSVVPQALIVTCGTPASATVQITAAPGFTGAVDLAARAWSDLRVAFTPSATPGAVTVTFSCDPYPGGGGGYLEITGTSDSEVVSTHLDLFVIGTPDAGSSSGAGGGSSSSSGGFVGPPGSSSSSSSGGGSSGSSGGWSSGGSSSGGWSSSGSSSGGSGGFSGSSSGGSGSGAVEGSDGNTRPSPASGVPAMGCASAGGAEGGVLGLGLLLWAARASRRRGVSSPAV